MLTVSALAYEYDRKTKIKIPSFTIEAGGALFVSGPNGAGKSTLLRLCAGFLKPTEGNIVWHQSDKLLEELVSYIGVNLSLEPNATVYEELRFCSHMVGKDLGSCKQIIQLLQLKPLWKKQISTLSHGQKMRVAIAKILIEEKKCWVLDEPFAILDNEAAQVFYAQIAKHCQKGGIVLIASHQSEDRENLSKLDISVKELPLQSLAATIEISKGFMNA